MTDGEALLKAVLASPEEDTPRLVYADWLDEQGDGLSAARAEFIRLQAELATTNRTGCCDSVGNTLTENPPAVVPCDCRWAELRRREWRLLAKYAKKWLDGLWSEADGVGPSVLKYVRGFCVQLSCDWDFWKGRSGVILKRHPIEKVTLTTLAAVGGFPLAPDHLRSNPEWDKIAFEYSEYVPWRPPQPPRRQAMVDRGRPDVRSADLSMGDA